MPDAFHPRKSAAALLAAAAVVLPAGCGAGGGPLTPPPPHAKPAACKLDLRALSVTGCPLLKSDTASAVDPSRLWGRIDCANPSRHQRIPSGGDPHPTGAGERQPDSAYRRLTVFDGDQVFGERCELGLNDHRGTTFSLYGEGEHRVTFMSIRLPPSFPLSTTDWQLVMQMKQTQPSDNGNGTPVLSLEARENQWKLVHSDSVDASDTAVDLWSTPAATETWTRFAFDVVYSQRSDVGRIQVYADLNGDGDALDPGEQSPPLTTYTLKRETAPETEPDRDGLAQGESIPSHLRLGIYHHEPIPCPAPAGCAVDVDNVQVYAVP